MRLALLALFAATTCSAQFAFRTNDVVAFVGGTDVVTAQQAGHLEALLTIHYRPLKLRFRNFGWEGDTVFAQPRDFGFPPLEKHLEHARATVIVFQFGRGEALDRHPADEFIAAYKNFLERFTNLTSRFLLVIPPRFDKSAGLLPDLSLNNRLAADYAKGIRQLKLPTIDLSSVTADLQIAARGHALIAAEFARQLGLAAPPETDASSAWLNPAFEKVRQTVIVKNQLWFDYWRPQNWAFLGGDRVSVPSSRDHLNPKVRWFPAEMEKFLPLIAKQEAEIRQLATAVPP